MTGPGTLGIVVRDPYAELGVTPEADAGEIRAAYLRLMREHHPDHHGSTERASRVNAAYDLLSRRTASDRRAVPAQPPARALRAAYSQQRAAYSRSFSAATLRVAAVLLVLGTLLLLLAAQ